MNILGYDVDYKFKKCLGEPVHFFSIKIQEQNKTSLWVATVDNNFEEAKTRAFSYLKERINELKS